MIKNFRRITALALTVVMLLSIAPLSVLADVVEEFSYNSVSMKNLTNLVHTRRYEFHGFNGILVDTQIVKKGGSLVDPGIPDAPSGQEFTGWFVGDEQVVFNTAINNITATETVTANARFKEVCYVSFVHGDIVTTKKVTKNTTTNADGVPLVVNTPGKAFSHWSTEINGSAFVFDTTPITADTTLYAVLIDRWTVTFDSNGGSAVLPKIVVNGDPIGALDAYASVRAGYTFKHWSLENGGAAISPTYVVNGDITLHAVWQVGTASYKVIYWQENAEDDDYTFESVVAKTGTTNATAGYDPKSYTGFHFDHADNTTISANGDTVVNVYYNRNVYTFTIERKNQNNNNWTTYSTTQLKFGQSTATQYNAAVAAYPYYSWYVSRTSNTAYSEAPAMPNENLTVHGRYSGSAYQYTIGYYEKGTGIEIKDPYSFYSGSRYLRFTIEDGIDIPGFTVTPLNQWDTLSPGQVSKIYYTRNNYTLTFNKNNGGDPLVISSIPFESDISDKDTTGLNASSTFVQNGITYHFAGWYDNSACAGASYSLAGKTMPAHNLALYAKWVPVTYTVTFYNTLTGGGIYHKEEGIIPMNNVPEPSGNPSGGTFLGWYWYIGGSFVKFDFDTPISGNFELYPVYAGQTASVSYDANVAYGGSGTLTDSNVYLVGAKAMVKNPGSSMSAPNKVFIGWNTLADGSGDSYLPDEQVTVPAGGITLYAQWGPITGRTSLTYKSNYPEPAGLPEKVHTISDLLNNETIEVLPNMFDVPSGYYFVGWDTSAGGSGSVAPGSEMIVDNNPENPNVLYACWKPKIAVTFTGESDTRTYTGSEQELTGITPSGLLAGHTYEGLTYSAKGTNVGEYDGVFSGDVVIKDGDVDVTQNYAITKTPGKLEITKASIAVTFTGESDTRTYTGSEQELTGITPSGLLAGHTYEGLTYSAKGTNVGEYDGVFSGDVVIKDGDVDVTQNYVITKTPGKLEITKASIAVTFTGESDTRTYTGSEQELTGITPSGFACWPYL
ncbi:MAG: InlB B-repeat-containing protein [Christensenellales bacterium]